MNVIKDLMKKEISINTSNGFTPTTDRLYVRSVNAGNGLRVNIISFHTKPFIRLKSHSNAKNVINVFTEIIT